MNAACAGLQKVKVMPHIPLVFDTVSLWPSPIYLPTSSPKGVFSVCLFVFKKRSQNMFSFDQSVKMSLTWN